MFLQRNKGGCRGFCEQENSGHKKNRPRNWWESFSWRSSVNESGFIKDSGMRFCNCWVSLGGTIGTMFVSVAMYCDELAWDDIYLDVNNEDIFYYLFIIISKSSEFVRQCCVQLLQTRGKKRAISFCSRLCETSGAGDVLVFPHNEIRVLKNDNCLEIFKIPQNVDWSCVLIMSDMFKWSQEQKIFKQLPSFIRMYWNEISFYAYLL